MLRNPCFCTNNRLQSQQSEESHGELFGRKQESKVIKIQSALTKCNTPRDFVSYYWPFWNYCYDKQSYVFIFALHFWVILGVKTCEVFLCFLVIFSLVPLCWLLAGFFVLLFYVTREVHRFWYRVWEALLVTTRFAWFSLSLDCRIPQIQKSTQPYVYKLKFPKRTGSID